MKVSSETPVRPPVSVTATTGAAECRTAPRAAVRPAPLSRALLGQLPAPPAGRRPHRLPPPPPRPAAAGTERGSSLRFSPRSGDSSGTGGQEKGEKQRTAKGAGGGAAASFSLRPCRGLSAAATAPRMPPGPAQEGAARGGTARSAPARSCPPLPLRSPHCRSLGGAWRWFSCLSPA